MPLFGMHPTCPDSFGGSGYLSIFQPWGATSVPVTWRDSRIPLRLGKPWNHSLHFNPLVEKFPGFPVNLGHPIIPPLQKNTRHRFCDSSARFRGSSAEVRGMFLNLNSFGTRWQQQMPVPAYPGCILLQISPPIRSPPSSVGRAQGS